MGLGCGWGEERLGSGRWFGGGSRVGAGGWLLDWEGEVVVVARWDGMVMMGVL